MSDWYALGKPGQSVRQLIQESSQADADIQCGSGEVAVKLLAFITSPLLISANGLSTSIVPPTLSGTKAEAWLKVRARRDQAEAAGCNTALGRIDTDADSQRKISGAVQMALIALTAGQSFSVGWTMHDNTTVEHDAQAMIDLGLAAGAHVATCHAVAVAKRALIMAASTIAEVEAVSIEDGWPASA